jgi:gamma-glutamylcyclotransferase (GGCT)/AIG2-like uncharacterized protein YtfP
MTTGGRPAALGLFVYGTLQDDRLVEELAGRPVRRRPAVLPGYRRTIDASIGYPVVYPAPGASVTGSLLEGIDDRILASLDAYEGAAYHRTVVSVKTDGGVDVQAYLYVPVSDHPESTARTG